MSAPSLLPTHTGERLQKALAALGIGSRRHIEIWIKSGQVWLNGQPAKLGDKVSPGDRVRIGQREIRLNLQKPSGIPRVIAYNKPEGQVVSRQDPEGRPTVFEALPTLYQDRWVAVGRLDLNTSGLLLFTTDGTLAHRLMHPSLEVEREYAVRVLGTVSQAQLNHLTTGVQLEEGMARFDNIAEAGGTGANRWYRVVLKEGRSREVRRLWEAIGVTVSRLIRLRYGNVVLGPRLFAGHWRKLEMDEIQGLLTLANLEPIPVLQPQPYKQRKQQYSRGSSKRS